MVCNISAMFVLFSDCVLPCTQLRAKLLLFFDICNKFSQIGEFFFNLAQFSCLNWRKSGRFVQNQLNKFQSSHNFVWMCECVKETSCCSPLPESRVWHHEHWTKLEFLPSWFRNFLDFAVTTPSVENHADGCRLDRLTFASTELDEIRCGEFSRQQS